MSQDQTTETALVVPTMVRRDCVDRAALLLAETLEREARAEDFQHGYHPDYGWWFEPTSPMGLLENALEQLVLHPDAEWDDYLLQAIMFRIKSDAELIELWLRGVPFATQDRDVVDDPRLWRVARAMLRAVGYLAEEIGEYWLEPEPAQASASVT